uniref:Cell division cycle protein 123 n=1 Tax=Chenopodium quinoa TaxID=63459 RepID=A0A803M0V0_CHEQI
MPTTKLEPSASTAAAFVAEECSGGVGGFLGCAGFRLRRCDFVGRRGWDFGEKRKLKEERLTKTGRTGLIQGALQTSPPISRLLPLLVAVPLIETAEQFRIADISRFESLRGSTLYFWDLGFSSSAIQRFERQGALRHTCRTRISVFYDSQRCHLAFVALYMVTCLTLLKKMKQEEVTCCQIQKWYPKFKPVSIKNFIHELPESFIQYLVGDSGPFLLPTSVSNEDALPNRIHKPEDEEDYQVSEGSEDESEPPSPPPSFPELELKIKDSIESLGGAVFPKLNWSSPKDAAWISTTGTLKCTSFSDIALLLKASDSVQLVGISQREVTAYYPAVLEKKDELKDLIYDFFIDNVEGRFKSENYTFDVYVTKDRRMKLIDFNPWGAFTLPLLFTWEELEQGGRLEEEVDFRIVESQHTVRPGLKTAVPYDYIDMSAGSGWDQFLRNADEELQQQMRSPEAVSSPPQMVVSSVEGGDEEDCVGRGWTTGHDHVMKIVEMVVLVEASMEEASSMVSVEYTNGGWSKHQ